MRANPIRIKIMVGEKLPVTGVALSVALFWVTTNDFEVVELVPSGFETETVMSCGPAANDSLGV